MSGVEIAGLALSVLPILLATVNQYKANRRNPRRAEFMTNLAYEIALFHMNLKTLAKHLELPNEIRDSLLSPQGADDLESTWKSVDVVYALKARLGSEHETFFVTLGVIMDCLEELLEKKSLGLSKEETFHTKHAYAKLRAIRDKASTTSTSSWNNRTRYFLKEARECDQILSKITKNNTQLQTIVSWDEALLPPEPLKESKPLESPYTQLRPVVHALHTALRDSWPCDSHREHEARLCLLEQRQRRRDSVTSEWKGGDEMYLDLSMSLSNEDTEPHCRWLEGQLCITLQQDVSPPPTQGVRFDLPANSLLVSSGCSVGTAETLIETANGTTGRRRAFTETGKVQKMCDTLLRAHRHRYLPQILFDRGSLWHVNSLPLSQDDISTASIQNGKVDTSIASLLRSGRMFKPKEKRILPVILASSLLHFCESSWSGSYWSKEHISFFLSGKGDLEIQRPYLSTRFHNIASEDDSDADCRIHPNSSILALGILLLEIHLDSPIDSVRKEFLYEGNKHANTDLLAATKLFESESGQLNTKHRQAVHACLKCDFFDQDLVKPSLDNPEFRQAVYENIVMPLEKEMEWGYELTLDKLYYSNESLLSSTM